MEVVQVAGRPCYAARLLKPFLDVLRAGGQLPEATLDWLAQLDPEERVETATVHAMLEAAVQVTGDELLGLKASAGMSMGDVGIFDFVLSSAATLRDALDNAGRYMRLLNDTLDTSLELEGERAVFRLESRVVVPAAAEDFRTCGLVHNHSRLWPEGMLAETDVWFRHPAPKHREDADAYQRLLGPVRIHFGAPLAGFGFPRRYLELPLSSRDPKLHEVLRHYAEGALARLPQPESVTEKVRKFVAEQLSDGNFSLEDAARELRMSSRTLGRRLSEEGTTFKSLVDEMRKDLSLRYVASHDLGLAT